MTVVNDKEIIKDRLPGELSFFPGATDTEQAVLDTDATSPFKWIVSDANIDIVVETTYGSFIYFPASAVTPGGFLPVANGKRIVTSHTFAAPLGTKTTGAGNIYLYGGV
jgi:hypothetical protein